MRTNPRTPGSKANYSQYSLSMERVRTSQIQIAADDFPMRIAAYIPILHRICFLRTLPFSEQGVSLCPIPLSPSRSLWPPWPIDYVRNDTVWLLRLGHTNVTYVHLVLLGCSLLEPRHHILRKPKQVHKGKN